MGNGTCDCDAREALFKTAGCWPLFFDRLLLDYFLRPCVAAAVGGEGLLSLDCLCRRLDSDRVQRRRWRGKRAARERMEATPLRVI